MIKQNWNVSDEDRKRILNLHESATKKHYLIGEQDLFTNKQNRQAQKQTKERKKGETVNSEEVDFFPRGIPKNVYFKFPLKQFKIRGSMQCRTDKNGIVECEDMANNDVWHKIPTIQEINLPKFLPFGELNQFNEYDYFLNGEEEWEWLNGFNEILLTRTRERPYIYVPAYDKYNFSLHFLYYKPTEITKGRARNMQEGENYLQANDNKYVVDNGRYWIVVGDDLPVGGNIPVPDEPTPPPPIPKPEEKPIVLDITKPFKFDKTELTDEAKPIFEKFIEDVKNNYQGVTADVDVITTASIDGDPDTILPNKNTRRQYDMDLSKRRAEQIVNELNKKVGIPTLKFIPKGIGQTSMYGPSWTKEKPTTTDETAPNRRLIIKLPKITKKVPS